MQSLREKISIKSFERKAEIAVRVERMVEQRLYDAEAEVEARLGKEKF